MDQMYHNGHGFLYKVLWREAGAQDARWNSAEVKSPPFLVQNARTYTPFEIKVQAVNSLGSGPAPEPEIGHSGEDSRSCFTFSETTSCLYGHRKLKSGEQPPSQFCDEFLLLMRPGCHHVQTELHIQPNCEKVPTLMFVSCWSLWFFTGCCFLGGGGGWKQRLTV